MIYDRRVDLKCENIICSLSSNKQWNKKKHF